MFRSTTPSYRKEYYEKNKEKVLKQAKESREKNKEKISKRRKERYLKNREVILQKKKANYICGDEKIWEQNIKYKFGITAEEYYKLLKQQEFKCAICKTDSLETIKGRKRLYIDHCHTTKKVRGLLCGKCNSGLGFFQENPEYLQYALDYLGNADK